MSASAPRVSKELRALRHKAEKAFRKAELKAFGVEPADVDLFSSVDAALEALHPSDVAGRETLQRRRQELSLVPTDAVARQRYVERHGVDNVTVVKTSGGKRIYRLVATTFPGHENYLYVVMSAQGPLLWDVGSGEHSRVDVLRGLQVVRHVYGEKAELGDFKAVVISHAHIDHFGDVAFFREHTRAPVMVHELDARVLSRFEECMVVASKDMGVFFQRAGMSSSESARLEAMYLGGKDFFRSVEVDRRLRHDQRILGDLHVIHTPGHCPGHICLRVDNALLVADQVLNPITPNLSPQSITPFNGLENYLAGLMRLRVLDGVDHVLPAHAMPIPSLGARIDEILEHHQERLLRVQEACVRPRTVAEVADALYGAQDGYNVILALVEAGAHVEYLSQHGRLRIANLDQVTAERDPVIQYVNG